MYAYDISRFRQGNKEMGSSYSCQSKSSATYIFYTTVACLPRSGNERRNIAVGWKENIN